MKESVSAGVILYRIVNGERQYLLLKSRTGDWEFPKGGIEGSEELQQTALRELKEEAGISNVTLIDGFRDSYDYIFTDRQGHTVHKEVHLFIGRTNNPSVNLSKEHHDLQWRTYEEAINTLSHSGPTEMLKNAHNFLESKESLCC